MKKTFILLVFLSIAQVAFINAQTITPQQVIDNYISALGGKEKLEGVESIFMKNTSKVMGMEVTGESKMMANPYRFYTKQTVMGQETVQVFDGEKGVISQGDQKMDMPANMVEKLKGKPLFDVFSLKADDFSDVATEDVDGKTYYVLSKDDVKNYFDKDTGLLFKTETPQGKAVITEYMTIDGIKFPSKMSQTAQGMTVEMVNTDVQFNKNVSAEDFKF